MLPDLLKPGLNAVFCGTAVSETSAAKEKYYSEPSTFYKTLYEVDLTPIQLAPADYRRLLDFGIGLTDLVKTKAGGDNKLSLSDFDVEGLKEKIRKFQPRFLCFNGKKAAEVYFEGPVDYGLQSECLGETKIFVAPSTSGSARKYWNIDYWHELADLVRETRSHH